MGKTQLPGDPDLDAKLDDTFGAAESFKTAMSAAMSTGSGTVVLPQIEIVQPARNLAEALARVQAVIPEVRKGETVLNKDGSKRYTYADLSAVTEAILPLLGAAGLAWITKPTMRDGVFALEYKLTHASGEVEEGVYPLPQTGDPQAIGSAITYARRYCLCSVTGVAPGDDDDAAEAQAAYKRTPEPAAPKGLSRFEQETGLGLLAVPTAQQRETAGITVMRQAFLQAVDFAGCLDEHEAWTQLSDGKESPTWRERMAARIADEIDAADDGDSVTALWELLKQAGLNLEHEGVSAGDRLKARGAAIKERNAKAYDTLVQQITTASLEDMLADPSPVADSVESAHRLGRITAAQKSELLELGKERYNRLKREQNTADLPQER